MSTPRDRFNAKVTVDASGCWLWTGARRPDGYGMFKAEGRLGTAHRWAYVQANGPVPDGLELDHLCNVRNCVNPAHLEPVTHAENQRRAAQRRTRCRRGHPMNEVNSYIKADGNRQCRPCLRLAKTRSAA